MKANGEVYRLDAPMTAERQDLSGRAPSTSRPAPPRRRSCRRRAGARRQRRTRPARRRPAATRSSRRGASRCGTRTTGSMPSGWTRYLLERFEFPFTVVCGAGFDDTELRSKYDVIVMPSGAAFRPGGGGGRGGGGGGGGGGGDAEPAAPAAAAAPSTDPDLRSLCQVTTGTGTGATAEANVKKFVEAGGVVIAAGSSARSIADLLDLPVSDYLVERQPGQPERALGGDKFYVPGSVVRVAVDTLRAVGCRRRGPCRRVLQQQPGVQAGAQRHGARHSPGDLVRLAPARCAAAGRGDRTISRAARPRSRRPSGEGWSTPSVRKSPSARSRTARSSSCSTGSISAGSRRRRALGRGMRPGRQGKR